MGGVGRLMDEWVSTGMTYGAGYISFYTSSTISGHMRQKEEEDGGNNNHIRPPHRKNLLLLSVIFLSKISSVLCVCVRKG